MTGDQLTTDWLTSVTGGLTLPWVLKVPMKMPSGWALPLAAEPCREVIPSKELSSDKLDTLPLLVFCCFRLLLPHDPLSIRISSSLLGKIPSFIRSINAG